MVDEIDPALDRDEFIRRLDNLFDPFSNDEMKKAVKELINDNNEYKTSMKSQIASMETKKNQYITAYDEAVTREEKKQVVASVKK